MQIGNITDKKTPYTEDHVYLNNSENNEQRGEDLHVRPLRVQVRQPEENSAGVEATADTVKLRKEQQIYYLTFCKTIFHLRGLTYSVKRVLIFYIIILPDSEWSNVLKLSVIIKLQKKR